MTSPLVTRDNLSGDTISKGRDYKSESAAAL